jgi:hypothetical protein
MAIVLGPNQYGKAEIRLVHIDRSTTVHQIKDVNVTSQLTGDFSATHATGDNSGVIATDTQKNAVYALARVGGVGPIEDFALRMAELRRQVRPGHGTSRCSRAPAASSAASRRSSTRRWSRPPTGSWRGRRGAVALRRHGRRLGQDLRRRSREEIHLRSTRTAEPEPATAHH